MAMTKILFGLFTAMIISLPLYAENKPSSGNNSAKTTPSASFATSQQDTFDPYTELEKMKQDLSRVLQTSLSRAGRGLDWAQTQSGTFNPKMDLVEEKERYIMQADIPGMDKSKLDVKVTDNLLTIAGERNAQSTQQDKAAGVYQQERTFGRFERSVTIPDNVQKDKISAKYDAGVLTVELPKIKPTAPPVENSRKIPVQ